MAKTGSRAWHAITQQLASCAAAEALDGLLIRPGCLAGAAWLARPLPGGVWLGFAAGKVAADLAWYGMEAAGRHASERTGPGCLEGPGPAGADRVAGPGATRDPPVRDEVGVRRMRRPQLGSDRRHGSDRGQGLSRWPVEGRYRLDGRIATGGLAGRDVRIRYGRRVSWLRKQVVPERGLRASAPFRAGRKVRTLSRRSTTSWF
jgi:hypothetical protein